MRFVVAAVLVALTAQAYHATSGPLTATAKHELVASNHWNPKCPVPLSGLRLITLSFWGWDGQPHTGQLVVNAKVVGTVEAAFGKLYAMRFPVHHMKLSDAYGPVSVWPKDLDVTYSFSCRQAVKSPCSKGGSTGTGSWSMHAYGEAIDLNPIENPYVGCGQTRDKTSVSFMKRTPLRKGMVTPAAIDAFTSVGWGWGGSWYGSTKDYMHFSANGH